MAIIISGPGIDMGQNAISNASQVEVQEQQVSPFSGFKNYIINGNFDIWQRGNGPFTNWNYGADRWVCHHNTAIMSSSSTSSNGIQKRIAHIQNVTAGNTFLAQAIELPLVGFGHPFTVGKKFTVSVRYSSTTKIRPRLIFRDGAVGAHPVDLDSTMTSFPYKGGSDVAETVSWTFTVNGTAVITNNCLVLSLDSESASSNVYLFQVQLEEGSVATPFENRPYGLELSLCQRYYAVNQVNAGFYSPAANSGWYVSVPHPVQMRVKPTCTIDNPNGQGNIGTLSSIGTNTGYNIISGIVTNIGAVGLSTSIKLSAEL